MPGASELKSNICDVAAILVDGEMSYTSKKLSEMLAVCASSLQLV